MTNKEIVDAYLGAQGFRRITGGNDDFSPILPFIMLDGVYQMYCKTISGIFCRFEMKRYRNDWEKSYNAFNKAFFDCFSDEQRDAIIDKMDSFADYIGNYLTIAKVQIMNCLKHETEERQEVLATCLLCSILVQSSQIVWRKVYKDSKLRGNENMSLKRLHKAICDFMGEYYGKNKPHIKVDEEKSVSDAVNVLCHKMINWLYI